MTTNQYKQEDNLPDTVEQTTENYLAQAGSLDGLVQQTADGLNEIEQRLGWVYQKAEAAGDNDMKVVISETWALAQQNSVRVTQLDAARLASIAMMKRMAEVHAKLAGEYDELHDAVADMDISHPMVSRLVEDVETDTREYMSEMESAWMEDEALEIAYQEVFTELIEGVRELTGSADWHAVYRLTDMLSNNGLNKPTDEQIDLLKRLVASFAEPQAAAS